MTKEQILEKIANEKSYESWGECMYDTHEHSQIEYACEAMQEYADQELAKERERYDKLYSEFNEVCRQVQINKDRCGRYEEAYHSECERSAKMVEALRIIAEKVGHTGIVTGKL